MADQFAEQFKRYWAIIVSVAGIVIVAASVLYTSQIDTIRSQAELAERVTRLEEKVSVIAETTRDMRAQAQACFLNQKRN